MAECHKCGKFANLAENPRERTPKNASVVDLEWHFHSRTMKFTFCLCNNCLEWFDASMMEIIPKGATKK